MNKLLPMLILSLLLVSPAQAIEKTETQLPRPAIFEELMNCRTIENDDQRLACYDRKIATLDEAQKNEEIIVTDREAVKEAKRGLFGLSLPQLKIFGKEGAAEVNELTSTIVSARRNSAGKLVIILEDGARWEQIDTKKLARDAKPGMSIVLKKAAFGSFFAKIDRQTAIRMKRAN